MNLIREYIGLLAKLALTGGPSAPERILDAMNALPADIRMDRDLTDVWNAMHDLASKGERPVLAALKRAVPGRAPEYWQSFSPSYPDLASLQGEIIRDYQRTQYREFGERLGEMVKDISVDPDLIRDALYAEAERPITGASRATPAERISFTKRIKDMHAGKLAFIKTPWRPLNTMLGGGLFVGGDLAMTSILGYTGAGKTQFAVQIGVQALRDAHWVLYFAGESTKEAVTLNFARIHDLIAKSDVLQPSALPRLEAAEQTIQQYPLHIYDLPFNPDVLRSMMAGYAAQLRDAKSAGTADPNALLLVIVDNLDHAIPGGQKDEWKLIEQAARGIYQTAKRLEIVHAVVLAQATEESYRKGEAPDMNHFARSKLIGSHCANIVGLYRGEAGAKVLVSKSRNTGSSGGIQMATDDRVGMWEA